MVFGAQKSQVGTGLTFVSIKCSLGGGGGGEEEEEEEEEGVAVIDIA